MKVGILYFSGTGVTGYTARSIAEVLERGGCEVDLVRFKKGIDFDPHRYDILGFGAPTYSFFPPRVFYRFLKRISCFREDAGAPESSGKPFFLFNTAHHLPGITVRAMYRVLSAKGWTLAAPPLLVRGVNNIRAWRFPKDQPPPRDSLIGLEGVDRLAGRLLDPVSFDPGPHDPLPYGPSGGGKCDPELRRRPGLALFTALFSWDWAMALVEGFSKRVDEKKCSRCGRCVEMFCPAGAITIDLHSGYPKIRNLRCLGCSGCVNLCPEDAIFTSAGSKRHPLTKFRRYL